jgi:ribosomal protein S18 acetylase RimI-like enzyme
MEKMIEIREAINNDLKNIHKLDIDFFDESHKKHDKTLNLNWPNTYNAQKWFDRRINDKKSLFLVAESDDKLVGYFCGSISKVYSHRKRVKSADLENIFISGNYRRKHLGSQFVEKFIKWCKENKVKQISVSAFANNQSAINFYHKFGFINYVITMELNSK